MLRNNNTVLSNEGKIFKSQAVDSYLTSTDYYYRYYISTSGLTETNPLRVALSDGNSTQKILYKTDVNNYYQNIYFYNSNVKTFYLPDLDLPSDLPKNLSIIHAHQSGYYKKWKINPLKI